MRKAMNIIGLPVIVVDNGRKIGEVRDEMLGEWELKGLLLDPKYWFGSARVLPCEGIHSLGTDAVMLSDLEAVHHLGDFTEHGRLFLSGKKKLLGLPVVTLNGEQLGYIEDVYFDEKMERQIIGFELTDGFISDITEGRKIVMIDERSQLGEDAVIVYGDIERKSNHPRTIV